MLIPQPLNLLIRINTIILQSNKVLPTIKIQHRPQNLSGSQLRKRGVLLMLMFDLLGRAILFLFLFLNSSFKRKNQLNSGILRNIVGYQVVFAPMRNLAWAAGNPFSSIPQNSLCLYFSRVSACRAHGARHFTRPR
jgi:hypothetical protein